MNFKIGDRVKMTTSYGGFYTKSEGTVVRGSGFSARTIGVEFDEKDAMLHNCGGRCKYGHGWFVYSGYLKLAKPRKIKITVKE